LAEKNKISLTISSAQGLSAIINSGKKVSIHLKVDTGMHRQGFFAKDLETICKLIKQHQKISVEGLYTHFASAKKPDSHKETEKQITIFRQAINQVRAAGLHPIVHAAATAGTLNYPEAHFDMVRIGIGLYGLWPSPETQKALGKKYPLWPVLTWKSIVSEAKWVEKGEKVGYESGINWVGEFLYRRANLKERAGIKVLEAQLNGDLTTVDLETRAYNEAIAHLRFTLHEFPDWWKDSDYGGKLYDTNIILELYKATLQFEAEWREKVSGGNAEAVEEKNDKKSTRASSKS
jgi:hypothetical protein